MIETQSLKFSYNPHLTFNFPDVKVNQGENLLISGKSGSGKTTLLHLLALLQKPASGKIFLDNTNVELLSKPELNKFRAEKIGLVFQKNYFVKSLNVMDNLLISPYFLKKKADLELIKHKATELRINHLLQKKTYELSGGELQRVSILRTIMNKPSLILADEPTSNLDDENCEHVVQLIQKTAKEANSALIIVTHDQRLKTIFPNQIHLENAF